MTETGNQRATDTSCPTINPDRFLGGAVKLQQSFTDMTILDAVPDVMG
ncbi:hypothetical protein CFT9_18446 [Pseudomonas sp. CFT9]|nr:hypothetical protein CFT9_18446 [Pseudomonas sp. CFT9]